MPISESQLRIVGQGEPLTDFTDVTLDELTAKEAIDALYDNKILVITDYDGNRDRDFLLRLYKDDTMDDYITQMSYDADTSVFGKYKSKRTWHVADISLNQLSLYPVYEYNRDYVKLARAYMKNDMVKYKTPSGEEDIAVIKKVWLNEAGKLFYTLTGQPESLYFSHDEIKQFD